MKQILAGMIATALVMTFATAPAPAANKKMAHAIKCPSCGMMMPTHRTAMMTVPVRIHGVTYYCCPMCPSGKKALAAMHHKKAV